MRLFPNIVVMAPGDAVDLEQMIDFAIGHDIATSIRYPKSTAERIEGPRAELQLGKAEQLRDGSDGTIICFGTLLGDVLRAADLLRDEGLRIRVINARFAKPLDEELILPAIETSPFVITVEEGQRMTGFGGAVLEAANDAGLQTQHITRLGIPDEFVEHGERAELLADLGLDSAGIARCCRQAASRSEHAN
jgi:1-deoxy-D-xylulose-5-phosphate synthase